MKKFVLPLVLAASFVSPAVTYTLVKEYSGQNFFDDWDFFNGYDPSTYGDTQYVGPFSAAQSAHLAYVDSSSGHAFIKVDNTTNVAYPNKRNTIEIYTEDFYPVGSVFIMDAAHLPWGCSVWPSFWTRGSNWPYDGEIDIIEYANLMGFNQMALHTAAGCTHTTPSTQEGSTIEPNCNATSGAGCTVMEKKANSYGPGFASAGGGVFAAQFDVSGIYIWFWSRPDVPSTISISNTTIDPSTWGAASAAYPASSCDIASHFGNQQLVIDIQLCGAFGDPTYNQTCTPGDCYLSSVIGPGSPTYDNAYFEISYVRVFGSTNATNATTGGASSTTGSATGTSASGTGGPAATQGGGTSGAPSTLSHPFTLLGLAGVVVLSLVAV
ncbi:glycoside hydrolase family 16 protein [Neolentinus lepideus HHB14362 ss-1]|uniref:Glycoside hydrolase family 16 protein n=1 Tax=Neolentinus lepideus HHB14362 ss-1 TaxID=1314782 RepID=A0A165N0L0_9AGAM|nr:glycoside hydrolase family 16 protein [Neolentinus lepideus HHB14362 ss-1]